MNSHLELVLSLTQSLGQHQEFASRDWVSAILLESGVRRCVSKLHCKVSTLFSLSLIILTVGVSADKNYGGEAPDLSLFHQGTSWPCPCWRVLPLVLPFGKAK